jgi:pyruvate kinase
MSTLTTFTQHHHFVLHCWPPRLGPALQRSAAAALADRAAWVQVTVVSRQMLASMGGNPRPTRAEMLDVANAVFESADALMLGDETAIGNFPVAAVATMASIIVNAEEATNYVASHAFVRDFSAKPFGALDAACAAAARTAGDTAVAALVTVTTGGEPAQIVCKFRPAVPQIVLTGSHELAAALGVYFGCVGVHWPALSGDEGPEPSVAEGLEFIKAEARKRGVVAGARVAVLHGAGVLPADAGGVLSMLQLD